MENQSACVWATSTELWDSFLNDPELARALDNAKGSKSVRDENAKNPDREQSAESSTDIAETGQRIQARLRAYETPITDEILRQSIR